MILIKSKGQLLVNFDLHINEFLCEVQIVRTMNIVIPDDMMTLYLRKRNILSNYDSVKVSYLLLCCFRVGGVVH